MTLSTSPHSNSPTERLSRPLLGLVVSQRSCLVKVPESKDSSLVDPYPPLSSDQLPSIVAPDLWVVLLATMNTDCFLSVTMTSYDLGLVQSSRSFGGACC